MFIFILGGLPPFTPRSVAWRLRVWNSSREVPELLQPEGCGNGVTQEVGWRAEFCPGGSSLAWTQFEVTLPAQRICMAPSLQKASLQKQNCRYIEKYSAELMGSWVEAGWNYRGKKKRKRWRRRERRVLHTNEWPWGRRICWWTLSLFQTAWRQREPPCVLRNRDQEYQSCRNSVERHSVYIKSEHWTLIDKVITLCAVIPMDSLFKEKPYQ